MEAGRKAGSPATAARGSVLNDGGPCKLRSNDLPGPSEEAILVATPVETQGLALSEGLELIDLGSNQAAPSVQANNFKFWWRQALILNLNLVEGFQIK